jgi:hypothetical protein
MVGISSEAFGCIGIINHLFLSCALYLGSKLPPLAQALTLLALRTSDHPCLSLNSPEF